MNLPSYGLSVAKRMHTELVALGASEPHNPQTVILYDALVTDNTLRNKTEKLFKDGHHARSVEEAFKLLENVVKDKADLSATDLSGASLMQKAFSVNKPILKLNEGLSTSEKDEQLGYMSILSGCMTGIRNPRAHESEWEDTEQHALQLLVLANHLIERVLLSKKVEPEQ